MSTEFPDSYFLRVPVSSSIYPRLTLSETFSALRDANASLPSKIRLPVEILHMINNEVHDNTAYEEVRSKWTPIKSEIKITSHIIHLPLLYDTREKAYLFSKETDRERRRSGTHEYQLTVGHTVSSADLLYRLRCFFPEVYVSNQGWTFNKNKPLWETGIRHRDSGHILFFNESMCGATVRMVYDGPITHPCSENVVNDAVQLMEIFFRTIDGKQLLYFHPAVEGRLPAADERFIAVPPPVKLRSGKDWGGLNPWYTDIAQPADLSFRSLLRRMPYDIESRRVDAVNGKSNLTDIISSSLLFYRLLGHYHDDNIGVDHTSSVTSVWQVKLVHRKVQDATIIFMDDCGLFDIRADGENVEMVMKDIVALVDTLLGDNCRHPCSNVLAGCLS